MNIKILKKESINSPQNANHSDSGYDLIAISDPVIVGEEGYIPGYYKSIKYIEYDTGLQIEPEMQRNSIWSNKYGYTLIYPRSSISKYNLLLCNSVGIIDYSYRGNLILRFRYITQPEDFKIIDGGLVCSVNQNKIYKKGDKLGQLVAAWKEDIHWLLADKIEETNRGENGFGSSGK